MPTPSPSLLSCLRMMVAAWRDDPRDDAELLARFAEARDEAAFTALVGRHGPLVWRACQRLLGDTPDAEDAFQATFLALARQTGRFTIGNIAGWLHRVARRIALNIQTDVRRRQSLEQRLRALTHPLAEEGESRVEELYAALDEELTGLPERLRVPLMLHYLEGRSQVEVARFLGCSRGIVQRRLARGEAILRARLKRRGLGAGVVSVGALLGNAVTTPTLQARLIGRTARAAVAFRFGTLTDGTAEAARAALGSLPSPLVGTIMRKGLWIALACVCSLGVGLAAWQAPVARSDATGSPEPVASPKRAAESGSGPVDLHGDPLPHGALARLGTLRLRHVGSYVNREGTESVVFSSDGKLLLTVGPANPIRIWEASTGKLLRSLGDSRENPAVSSLVLSPDGNTLAVRNKDGSVSLWEVATAKLLRKLGENIRSLAFSRDGRTLFSAGIGNHLRIWEVATGKVLRDQPLENADKAGISTSVFSPDGKTLASIDKKIVHLWETTTGKKLRQLSLDKEENNRTVAFSPDSRFLAVSGNLADRGICLIDGAIYLWEVATGKEVRKWTPDKTGIYSLAFSPDSKIMATGSGFGPIRLWETATGKQLRQCEDYRALVVALAFSSDGRTLASLAGLHDHTARLWEVASGKEQIFTSRGHVGPVLSVAFAADGKSVISGGRDGLVGLWNAETGQEQRPPLRAGDFQALSVLSADGKIILSVGNNFSPNVKSVVFQGSTLVCVWDKATGQKLREFKGPEGAPQSLSVSPDGKILVLSFWRSVYLMEVATGKTIRKFMDVSEEPKCAALSPDGKVLAVFLHEGRRRAGEIHFYATDTGKDLGSIWGGPSLRVWCLAFSPDGQMLAAAGTEEEGNRKNRNTVCLWRVRSANQQWKEGGREWKEGGRLIGHEDVVWTVAFSPNGKTLASTSKDGTLRLWEVATGKERRRFAGHNGEVWSVAFSPDGRRLAAGSNDTTILIWDVTGRLQNGQLSQVKLSAQEVKGLWADLAGTDAVRAGQAVWTLAAAPAQAIPLLREHLRPVAPAGPRIARLIADLDSDTFAVRQKATDELAKLGEVAELALRQALAKSPSVEIRRRLKQLLEPLKAKFLPAGKELRSVRALEVLEQMRTPEALPLLEALAGGVPEARQTLEAQAILKRLGSRVNGTKP